MLLLELPLLSSLQGSPLGAILTNKKWLSSFEEVESLLQVVRDWLVSHKRMLEGKANVACLIMFEILRHAFKAAMTSEKGATSREYMLQCFRMEQAPPLHY